MPETKIRLDDDDFGAVLTCAIRYCFGRQTYMPGLIMDYITPLLPYVADKTLWCFDADLQRPDIYGGLGHETIDKPRWIMFHEAVKREIQNRKDNKEWKF